MALDKRSSQPKPIKTQGIFFVVYFNSLLNLFICHCFFFIYFYFHDILKDGKVGNPDRQNNGPAVVKASKDKKKVNIKVKSQMFYFAHFKRTVQIGSRAF